ncbi:hypothetical protein EJ03DRAFT_346748 [Teratosphaeria nubilosa]|uniref:UbiA prenyltransferase n=1 Tax=Teratosphaeria nubilosa TaxID=161662 RepID=A0A6G1LME4_9PEZI|nr:hypothetical protein EJ03DRAFT_346748 [Teratosphaeria nubilosa]
MGAEKQESSLDARFLASSSKAWRRTGYHLYTLWLFTRSDLKTIVGPSFLFGVTNALAAPAYNIAFDSGHLSVTVAQRSILALLWVWAQLLPFSISNQNSPAAIAEDGVNKPWRPLPSKRVTSRQASRVMVALYGVAVVLSGVVGGLRQSLGLVVLGGWYNYLAGGDASWIVRNSINAAGYVCFTSGAMEVSLGQRVGLPVQAKLATWFGVLGAVNCSTIQLQDMTDQEGDRVRGRKTLPLVVGDGAARWMTAVPLMTWGFACPAYWGVGMAVRGASLVLVGVVTGRCLALRSVVADAKTYPLYNVWIALVFVLPLLSQKGW